LLKEPVEVALWVVMVERLVNLGIGDLSPVDHIRAWS
jgi:hypothetical protein